MGPPRVGRVSRAANDPVGSGLRIIDVPHDYRALENAELADFSDFLHDLAESGESQGQAQITSGADGRSDLLRTRAH